MKKMNQIILGTRIDPTSYETVCSQVLTWAKRRESRTVCAANVHLIMEAHDSLEFQRMVNSADLVTPDGMPLVWTLRRLGHPHQARVYGPDLTLKLVEAASAQGVPVGFYGSTTVVLEKMIANIQLLFPALMVVYSFSPPFRPLTMEEDQVVLEQINTSGVRILFVGLGCPRQERWIAEHKGRVEAVMLAVGAAFDFHAGIKPMASVWMQKAGLEWLFRLVSEPKRLWRRYLIHNPRFLWLVGMELIGLRKKIEP
jgi:N-acetylglucosaminyldiphosphoundecaprenol N-acetyl-beta-D-mannosaminyltransferase